MRRVVKKGQALAFQWAVDLATGEDAVVWMILDRRAQIVRVGAVGGDGATLRCC